MGAPMPRFVTSRRDAAFASPILLVVGLLAIIGAAGVPADSPSGTRGEPAGRAEVEWVQITYGDETRVDVAVFRPEGYSDSGSHPLILALPWGAGTPGLVVGMVDAYWNAEASRHDTPSSGMSTARAGDCPTAI